MRRESDPATALGIVLVAMMLWLVLAVALAVHFT